MACPCSAFSPFQLEPRWYAENKAKRSFDLCGDSNAAAAFFPSGRGAMLGTFVEVPCNNNWSGSEGESLWGGSCMANDATGLWPAVGCGNRGTMNSLAPAVIQFG